MQNLADCISQQVQVSPENLQNIVSQFLQVSLKKNEFFLRSGTVCRKMAFIESGYLRMFNIANGKEVTFWIGGAGKFITSVSSFVFETMNYWQIQAATDCKLWVISRENHFSLTRTNPVWLEFDNKLLAHAFALLEKSMFAQLHTTASERLDALLDQEPDLFLHVPHHYLASMIGITPESLSRLRKNKANAIS